MSTNVTMIIKNNITISTRIIKNEKRIQIEFSNQRVILNAENIRFFIIFFFFFNDILKLFVSQHATVADLSEDRFCEIVF